MLTRRPALFLLSALAALSFASIGCQKVPLLAPTGSTITLTASTTAVSANGTTVIRAQILEAAGTPPHSGTHVTFTTTLGRIEPTEASTDINGQVTATFVAGGANGTAIITALSGGATTGTDGAIKIFVGTAALGFITVRANPTSLPSSGGSSTVSAYVLDVNGNPLVGAPVSFTTTAGTLSSSVVLTDANGTAATTLTTSAVATVTATVGSLATTTPTTVTVNVLSAPSISITPPTTIQKGLPATFTFTVTAASTNGAPIKEVTVNWGDGSQTESLGAFTGASSSSHRYDHDGTYRVSATVTDVAGGSGSVSTSVTVIELAGTGVSVNASPLTQTVNNTVTFTITITPPAGISIVSSSISYGDGTVDQLGGGTSFIKTHSYTTAGVKSVVVSTHDTANRDSQGSTSVTIN